MKVKFLDSMVEVNTCEESILFSWMLFHKDAESFRLGNVYVDAKWDGPAAVHLTVKDDHHEYTKYIDNPCELAEEMRKKIDIHSLNYHEYGNYSFVNSKGYLTVAQDGDRIKLKVEDNFSTTDVSHNTMSIHPDVKLLGIDEDGRYQYIFKFKNSGDFRFFYGISNPLDSYFEEA